MGGRHSVFPPVLFFDSIHAALIRLAGWDSGIGGAVLASEFCFETAFLRL
jgi:hypothetical protein